MKYIQTFEKFKKTETTEKINENVHINENINPYIGYYKVRDLNKIMNDFTENGIMFKFDDNRNVIVENNLNTAQRIIYENGGMMDFDWLKKEKEPSDGIILKCQQFDVPEGAML